MVRAIFLTIGGAERSTGLQKQPRRIERSDEVRTENLLASVMVNGAAVNKLHSG